MHLQGYRIGNKEINIVCYANDTALIAGTEDDLQRLSCYYLKFYMKISTHIQYNESQDYKQGISKLQIGN